jgi:hypothetical protein
MLGVHKLTFFLEEMNLKEMNFNLPQISTKRTISAREVGIQNYVQFLSKTGNF